MPNSTSQPTGGAARRQEGAEEHQLFRVLADVDEPAGSGEFRPELADIEIAGAIDLRKPEEGRIQPAAVVEVELIGLVDHRLGVDRRAKIDAAGGNAADHAPGHVQVGRQEHGARL